MSWLGSLFGTTKPVLPTTAAPPKNVKKNVHVEGENYMALPVARVDPTVTELKATPQPGTATGTQGGGRRKAKGKGRSTKGKKGKGKKRSTRK